jgi:ferredoxin
VVNPGGGLEDKIQEAIDACPVQCIHWTDQG